MIYLALSILSSIGIFVVFRQLKRKGANTRQAIMINYLVAALVGVTLFFPQELWFDAPWFLPSSAMGILFYIVFRIMAKVTQENGVSIVSVATKMSVVIPVIVGLVILSESISLLKVIGLLLGLIAVALTTGVNVKGGTWLWPALLFLGSGVIDASIKLFQHYLVLESAFPIFITNVFLFAFLSAVVHHLAIRNKSLSKEDFAWGVILGLVNFAALLFILKTLALPNWESSVVFPINNFGIIAGSTLIAVSLFKERLHARGWIGMVTALVSIFLLYASK